MLASRHALFLRIKYLSRLPSNPHVKSVYFESGDESLLSGAASGTLFIDGSTIDPNVSREVAAKCEEHGSEMIDAPVSGGVGGAEAGKIFDAKEKGVS